MPGTTLRGVSLYSRKREKHADTFDLEISQEGIAICRSTQEPRVMRWDRVASWEIEKRRRGLLLVLRGGGSVTPLLVPGWKVDDLNRLFTEMTAHLGGEGEGEGVAEVATLVEEPSEPEPEPVPDLVLDLATSSAFDATPSPALELGPQAPPLVPEIDQDMDLTLPPRPASVADVPGAVVPMDLSLPPLPPAADPVPIDLSIAHKPKE